MDTSEIYIKMRVAAIPDLGFGTPCQIPIAFATDNDNIWVDVKGDWYAKHGDHIGFQLERQDQLQEMIFDRRITAIVIAHESSNFAITIPKVKIGEDTKAYPNLSMERLWLAFVMKEIYNKVWDGEEWRHCKEG